MLNHGLEVVCIFIAFFIIAILYRYYYLKQKEGGENEEVKTD